MEAIDGSLERLGLDHVDLLFCHRPDPDTPVEETVRAMNDIVAAGKALYWGTSEWPADKLLEAWKIADKRNLYLPQMEQPHYNMFVRDKVEKEFASLYDSIGLGLTTFSPLASGFLSGKYLNGVPEGSRLSLPGFSWLKDRYSNADIDRIIKNLMPIAADLGCSLSQLALAWTAHNPRVSSVITGASKLDQLKENLGALNVLDKLNPEVMAKIEKTLKPSDKN